MTNSPLFPLVCAAMTCGLLPAFAQETMPPGIYAMLQDKSGSADTSLPEGLAEAALKACKNTPSVVYSDGLIRALRPNAMDKVQAGEAFFLPLGEMRCPQLTGENVICGSLSGQDLSEAPPLTVKFISYDAGIWRLVAKEKEMMLLMSPCDTAMFDITLPNGRNVLAEMTARPDGGPALTAPILSAPAN